MKPTILLADDSLTIQRLVAQTFADADYQVVAVSNGDAAIKKFEEIRPAIVLSDVYMPGKNGYEVCAHVKGHAELSATPVVLLAGAFDAFDEGMAKKAGAAAHITKPFEPQALIDLVASLLPEVAKKRARAEAAGSKAAELKGAGSKAVESKPVRSPDDTAPSMAPSRTEPLAALAAPPDGEADIFGLNELFMPPEPEPTPVVSLSEAEIERIADRVIQRLSTQVIESVAWDIVPEIAAKVLREELKKKA